MTEVPAITRRARTRQGVMAAALAVSVLLTGAKFYAYYLTGSAAILSDALESIINVVAAGFALFSVVLAAKSPDPGHPYGHGKIEYLAAGFEGALIILAALGIVVSALPQLLSPRELPRLELGVLFVAAVTLVNLALGLTLIHYGRRTDSLVLVADGQHLLTDVYTSAGVLAGLLLLQLTGRLWLDGLVALLVAANILYTGGKLLRQAVGGLLDESDPVLLERLVKVLTEHRKDLWIDVHRLRARRAGDRVLLDFHLTLPRDLTLEEGHREVKELEQIFAEAFHGQADLLIHLDPCTQPVCPVCGHDPCSIRAQEARARSLWKRQTVTQEDACLPPEFPKPEPGGEG
jgi:cation diffusion facilitator family transporter